MKLNRGKIIRYIVIFLAVMLFFTIVSRKVDYMLTPEVSVVVPDSSYLSMDLSASGTYQNGKVEFSISLEKDPYIAVGSVITADFANQSNDINFVVDAKTFDAENQSVLCTAKPESSQISTIYEGQTCDIRFSHELGFYDIVIPFECIVTEGITTYVYRVENVSSVLGDSQIVRKTEVTVVERDDFNAAIDGSLNAQDVIVRYSSKLLRDGAKVRMTQ